MLQFIVHNSYFRPFPYFVGEGAFPDDLTSSLIDWLNKDAPWRLVEADFYEQFEFDLMSVSLPSSLNILASVSALSKLRRSVGDQFRIVLREEIDVTAHKLISGQRIRLHNDFLPHGETHRLILQLNTNWSPECGGYLMLFNGNDPNQVHEIIPPRLNSLFGFAIGPSSFHAVSEVKAENRLSLVFSFYEKR